MPRRNRIRLGRYLVVDDRTGKTYYDDEMTREWTGVLVRTGTEDPRQPQEYIRPFNDPEPLTDVRPEQGTNFDSICGFYQMEYIPNTSIKRRLTPADELLPAPGIGQMSIGPNADECGYLFVVQAD